MTAIRIKIKEQTSKTDTESLLNSFSEDFRASADPRREHRAQGRVNEFDAQRGQQHTAQTSQNVQSRLPQHGGKLVRDAQQQPSDDGDGDARAANRQIMGNAFVGLCGDDHGGNRAGTGNNGNGKRHNADGVAGFCFGFFFFRMAFFRGAHHAERDGNQQDSSRDSERIKADAEHIQQRAAEKCGAQQNAGDGKSRLTGDPRFFAGPHAFG